MTFAITWRAIVVRLGNALVVLAQQVLLVMLVPLEQQALLAPA
jgi:hypothetical protein